MREIIFSFVYSVVYFESVLICFFFFLFRFCFTEIHFILCPSVCKLTNFCGLINDSYMERKKGEENKKRHAKTVD